MKNLKPPPHHCHVERCDRIIALNALLCPDHWSMVPRELKGPAHAAYHACQNRSTDNLLELWDPRLTEAEQAAVRSIDAIHEYEDESQLPEIPKEEPKVDWDAFHALDKEFAEYRKINEAWHPTPPATIRIGKRLRKRLHDARLSAGLGVNVTAGYAELAPSVITEIENGKCTSLPRETMLKLAEILKIPAEEVAPAPVPRRSIFKQRPADVRERRRIRSGRR